MKAKKNLLILLTIILLTGITTIVYAEGTGGGTGSGSGEGGTGSGGGLDSGAWWDYGSSLLGGTKSYRIDLVYKEENSSSREVLKTIVVNCGNGYTDVVRKAVNTYANKNASDGRVRTSGKWAEVACAIKNNNITNLSDAGYFSRENDKVIKELLNDMGIDQKQLRKKQDTNPGRINSYGYRFLIQQITIWGKGDLYSGGSVVAFPRKEAAKNGINGQQINGQYFGDNGGSLAVTNNYQEDIFTQRDDIGIKNAKSNRQIYSKSNFADKNNGTGYNIIWFYNPRSDLDYSIDAACENCEGTNENGSYYIQDTVNWSAILDSPNSTVDNAKTYYKKPVSGCEVFCREEYKIIFPNANDKITTEAGRFFTINKLGGTMYASGIPNYKQIKVVKVRECRALGNNQRACLENFASSAKARTKKSPYTAGATGTIKLKYHEDYNASKYNEETNDFNDKLIENPNRTISKDEYINSTVDSSSVMLKSTLEKYYELPDETYRWVNIENGISLVKKPSSNIIDHFLDIGTSNLPISNKNFAEGNKPDKGGTITFKYELPQTTEDPYTLIHKAFNAKNDYFLNPSVQSTKNIYAKNETGQIEYSACAKLYGYNSGEKYNNCANERKTNSAGKCYDKITKDDKYVCNFNVCPEGEMLCDENVCSENGECPNPKCQIVSGVYYDDKGNIVDETTYMAKCPVCTIKDGKYYGQTGKEVTRETYLSECPQICKIIDDKYYFGSKGQRVDKATYQKECPDSGDFCNACNGGKCCPDLEMVCPDENGECPGRGNTIIYRPIDLTNPFPGQTNYGRATGANWCSYIPYGKNKGKINCKNDNGVVTKHITNNRKNPNESVYSLNPLYEVDLDATTIKKIRGYNKGKKYDDFNLHCDGKTCYSNFLRDENPGFKITGECAGKTGTDAINCAERGGLKE